MFIVGMEEGLFPGNQVMYDPSELEEERRLCYVAITRAKMGLTISYAKQRMLYGRTNASLPSRFLKEIPEDLTVRKGGMQSAPSSYGYQRTQYPRQNVEMPYKPSGEFYAARSSQTSTALLDWKKGDMVRHTAFGKGMILSVIKMGGDALLEIAFDELGTKKLMANFAKLKKE